MGLLDTVGLNRLSSEQWQVSQIILVSDDDKLEPDKLL